DLAADMALRSSDAGRDFLAALARQAGLADRPSDVAAVLKTIGELSLSDQALLGAIVRGLSEGLAQRGSPLGAVLATDSTGKAAEALAQLLASAKTTAADREQPAAARIDAIRALGLDAFAAVCDVLAGLLDNREPQEIQVAAMGALAAYRDSAVADLVLVAWPGLSPRLRVQASEALFARAERTVALLDAIEAGRVHLVDLDAARLKQLAVGGDAAVRKRAAKLLASLKLGLRQDVVDAYRDVLDLAGDPQRGKLAFKKVCAACHKVEGLGHEIGPNLATIKNRGAESLLVNMLDPSREVNPQFVNYVLVTDEGRMMTGLVASETATSVTLKRGEDAGDTVLRINIDELRSTGLSLMPDGVEKQLTREEMADLIAYLLALK
ncbi:MAG TPA: c-type cytochrome, partial [Pirellulales bacterium]|nr:c-type cytochrome [Pirellulales bacterium]